MSIYTQAAIFVGLPYSEMTDKNKTQELIDDGELESCSPYFDCTIQERLVGFFLQRVDGFGEFDAAATVNMHDLIKKFTALTGQSPLIYLSNHVW